MSPRPPADSASRPLQVAIVGNDAVLAALPFRTMQLAHALHACGFDFVVPVSWGEELVAREVLRVLAERDAAPAIFCACPLQRARLLAAGSELASYLVSVASPTAATARYVRALHPATMRITAIGGCPGDDDPAVDARIATLELEAMLDAHGVLLAEQPEVFESVIPPDRRRFFSLPGGCPTPRMLEARLPERRMVTITDVAFADELADVLLGGESVLVDLSPRLACTCCGGFAAGVGLGGGGRDQILRREPPRASASVLELDITIDLRVDAQPTATARVERRSGVTIGGSGSGRGAASAVTGEPSASLRAPAGETPTLGDVRAAPAAHNTPATPDVGRAPDPAGAPDAAGAPESRTTSERTSGERPRIAVTPAGAVRGAARRRTAPPPAIAPPAATDATEAPRWTIASEHPARAEAGASEGHALPDYSIDARSTRAAGADRVLSPTAEANTDLGGVADASGLDESDALRLGDVAIPLEPAREGMPPADETTLEAGATWDTPVLSEVPAAMASGEMAQVTGIGEQHHRRVRAPLHRFMLARGQSMPHATAGGRRIPRAYARHLSAPTHGTKHYPAVADAHVAQLGDAGEDAAARVEELDELFATRTDVELRLDVSIEPPVTSLMFVSADPEEDDTSEVERADDAGVVSVAEVTVAEVTVAEVTVAEVTVAEVLDAESAESVAEDVEDVANAEGSVDGASQNAPDHAEESAEESTFERTTPQSSAGAEASLGDAGALPAASHTTSGDISEDVLSRVRQRARAEGRVISREVPAPRPPREPGSLAVFIASAVLIVALLVALAVIFGRLPTAPW